MRDERLSKHILYPITKEEEDLKEGGINMWIRNGLFCLYCEGGGGGEEEEKTYDCLRNHITCSPIFDYHFTVRHTVTEAK
jgi:hypothetical protein